jgi:hypothetical protein
MTDTIVEPEAEALVPGTPYCVDEIRRHIAVQYATQFWVGGGPEYGVDDLFEIVAGVEQFMRTGTFPVPPLKAPSKMAIVSRS